MTQPETHWYITHTKVYVHDPGDIPQMKELGKSVLPGVHTLAAISHSQVGLGVAVYGSV